MWERLVRWAAFTAFAIVAGLATFEILKLLNFNVKQLVTIFEP